MRVARIASTRWLVGGVVLAVLWTGSRSLSGTPYHLGAVLAAALTSGAVVVFEARRYRAALRRTILGEGQLPQRLRMVPAVGLLLGVLVAKTVPGAHLWLVDLLMGFTTVLCLLFGAIALRVESLLQREVDDGLHGGCVLEATVTERWARLEPYQRAMWIFGTVAWLLAIAFVIASLA